MPPFTDQTGRTIDIPAFPTRIVSVVPSQTELLYDLGLEAEVIGITKFCIHPAKWFRSKTRVGGTKNLNLDRIRNLQPDLILANKEENEKAQVEELSRDFPVWTSDIGNLDQALDMIGAVGEMTGKKEAALDIADRIRHSFDAIKGNPLHSFWQPPKTCYLIWRDPWMTVGRDTFIHDMLTRAGFLNVFADRLRYPETTLGEMSHKGCAYILLSSEPYPFSAKHIEEIRAILPQSKILPVDGEMFSWYGSRLLKAAEYFKNLAD